MGGDQNPEELRGLITIARSCGIKACLYSGCDSLQDVSNLIFDLDYIKIGRYRRECGGLDSEKTNQRFYSVSKGSLILNDQTNLFQRKVN